MESVERLRRMRNATLANAGMMIGSVGLYSITGNSAFIAEGIHDLADTGAHGSRYLAEKKDIDQHTKKFDLFLRSSLGAVGLLSGYAAYRFGVKISESNYENVSMQESAANLLGAVSIAGGNSYAYIQLKGIEEQSSASKASLDHGTVDLVASWGLAAFIGAEIVGREGASQWGAFLFSAYTAAHLIIHAIKPHKHNH